MSHAQAPTLAGFLLARIAEDEAVARVTSTLRVTVALDATKPGYGAQAADLKFVRRFDPARVLAESEAKRRIVGWLQTISESNAIHVDAWTVIKDICFDLALPYADHPDYRDEWRP